MAIDISSMFSSSNSVENLVDLYMRFEQGPKNRILFKQEQLNNKKSILSTLDSKLSSLFSNSEKLVDPIIDYFAVNKASSSDENFLTVSANSNATSGVFSIDINRLATADTRVSRQYTSTNTDFSNITSDQTFSISLAHPTTEDQNNRVTISVTLSASTFQKTSEEVMDDVRDAINNSINSAVTADTITSEEKISTSVVSESEGKSRMVLRSNQTGYERLH